MALAHVLFGLCLTMGTMPFVHVQRYRVTGKPSLRQLLPFCDGHASRVTIESVKEFGLQETGLPATLSLYSPLLTLFGYMA